MFWSIDFLLYYVPWTWKINADLRSSALFCTKFAFFSLQQNFLSVGDFVLQCNTLRMLISSEFQGSRNANTRIRCSSLQKGGHGSLDALSTVLGRGKFCEWFVTRFLIGWLPLRSHTTNSTSEHWDLLGNNTKIVLCKDYHLFLEALWKLFQKMKLLLKGKPFLYILLVHLSSCAVKLHLYDFQVQCIPSVLRKHWDSIYGSFTSGDQCFTPSLPTPIPFWGL